MKPYLPYRPYRPYLAGAVAGEAAIVPLFQDDLTDLAIDAGGTPTRGSTAYHQQPDGTWVSIASGAPRFYGARWTGSAWSLLDALGDPLPGPFGYLMEPVETNYCKDTADYSGASWTNYGSADMVASTAVNGLPVGRLKPSANVAAQQPLVYQGGIAALSAGIPFTFRGKFKADGYDALSFRVAEDTSTYWVIFNLANGTKSAGGANITATITALSGIWAGWYQCEATAQTVDTSQDLRIFFGPVSNIAGDVITNYTTDTTKGVLVADFKCFGGTVSASSSPVLTTTAAGIRAVDALSYADPVADNETRIVKRLVSDPETEIVVDIDDWNYSMPVPTVPTIIQSVTVWAPGERPA